MDVPGLPVKQLMAVCCGHGVGGAGGRGSQLRVQRQTVRHVHLRSVPTYNGKYFLSKVVYFFHLLPLPPYVPDEGVGHAVPGGGPAGGRAQHGVRPQVGGRVDDRHRGAVTGYVVTWAAAVIIVTCHVRCERCTVRI